MSQVAFEKRLSPEDLVHITANLLMQQLSALTVLLFPSQQGGAYNDLSPESSASTLQIFIPGIRM